MSAETKKQIRLSHIMDGTVISTIACCAINQQFIMGNFMTLMRWIQIKLRIVVATFVKNAMRLSKTVKNVNRTQATIASHLLKKIENSTFLIF